MNLNELVESGLNDNLFEAAPQQNRPDELYVKRVDLLFYKSFGHFRMLNSVLSIYSLLKILMSTAIFIVDFSTLQSFTHSQDIWCLLLIQVSLLQLVYYRLMAKETEKLDHFLSLAYTLQHIEYVHQSEFPAGQLPHCIKTSVNRQVYDFNNVDVGQQPDDKKINILAIQIKYQAQQLTRPLLVCARLSFILYQTLHFWALYLYFWSSEQTSFLLEKYIMVILIIGTYQYLEIYVIAVVVCIFLPFYGFVQLIRLCFLKINSNKFIRMLKPKTFRPSDVKGEHQCRVCLIPYTAQDKIITLPCNEMHHFHSFCIKTWLKVSITCPLCRQSFANLNPQQVETLLAELN